MATKILFNGNRIILDGHADTAEECRAITAMCDSLANNENFKTIVYESGHAVFEQVSGGESEMFAMVDYVLTSRYNAETGYSAAELAAKGTIATRLYNLEYDMGAGIVSKVYNWVDELAQYVSDRVEKTARVKGVWVLNSWSDNEESTALPICGIAQSLNFTAFKNSEATEPTSYNKITVSCTGGIGFYSENEWVNSYTDTMRTIDFGSEPQACSEEFINWLTANATAGEGADVEILDTLQERFNKVTAAQYKLPYTASELVEKLSAL